MEAHGNNEATIALAMLAEDQEERERLVKKAARPETQRECGDIQTILTNSFVPNPKSTQDSFQRRLRRKMFDMIQQNVPPGLLPGAILFVS